jgi:hypothetical protein
MMTLAFLYRNKRTHCRKVPVHPEKTSVSRPI